MKKSLSGIISLLALSTFACSVSADNHSFEYYDYISEQVIEDEASLRRIEKTYGDLCDYYNITLPSDIDEYDNDYYQGTNTPSFNGRVYNATRGSGSSGTSTPMTNQQWYEMVSMLDKGDILVTKDYSTLWANHGHCAIMYENGLTVEHPGNNYSRTVAIGVGWKPRHTMRSYHVSMNGVGPEVREAAADYAYENLQGLAYNWNAKVTDNVVNCATLVWKAFNNVPPYVSLDKLANQSCKPICFVETTKTTLWYSVNWDTASNVW